MQEWAFRIGPVATKDDASLSLPPGLSQPSVGETENLKYRVLEAGRCIFRRKLSLFAIRWNTPLEIKGTIHWAHGTLCTIGRYPLGTTLFFAGWLTGCTVFGVLSLVNGKLIGFAVIGIGWVFAGVMMAHSRSLELRRFHEYAGEMTRALQAGSRRTSG